MGTVSVWIQEITKILPKLHGDVTMTTNSFEMMIRATQDVPLRLELLGDVGRDETLPLHVWTGLILILISEICFDT